MNLSKDEMDFLNNVVFSDENMTAEFERWVESFELYLGEDRRALFI